ncbi:MAG: tetratricopeptide repeat protein [Chitinispirillaceae bacterium]|jgi:tetratricopeptide (TPR) repeat protein|nr:tetratricopeptide repeat protein [Chitinispirillaceae bacterium]
MNKPIRLSEVILILVAAIVAYHGTFTAPFVFDDEFSIVKNSSIRTIWPLGAVLAPPGDGNPVQGRPVLNLTFAINYALGGTAVFGYHLVNLLIHILTALLLFGIIRRTLEVSRIPEHIRKAANGIALATALIWVVHPLTTAAVTYVTQRAESLAAFFCLLTLWCFIRSAAERKFYAVMWSMGAVAACVLGMATKEVMVSAPMIIFMYDAIFLSKGIRDVLKKRLLLHAALAATWFVLALLVIGAEGRGGTAGFNESVGALRYAGTQIWAIVHYIRLCFWPTLVFDYGTSMASAGEIILAALILIPLLAGIILGFRKHPNISFVGIVFFAILAPSSSFVPVATQTVAEHRMYLPLAAVILLVVLAAFAAGKNLLSKNRFAGPLVCVAISVVFCYLTVQRNVVYQSEHSLWQDTLDKRPNNVRAATYLGSALMNDGSSDAQSLIMLNRAVSMDSAYGLAYANRGLVFARMRRFDDALRDYNRAVALRINRAELFNNRGILFGEAGRTAEAIADFTIAVQINPLFAAAHSNLGSAYVNVYKASANDSALAAFTQAIGHYTTAIRCDSQYVAAYRGRASAYGLRNMYAEAAHDCSGVIRCEPSDAVAYSDRAICEYHLGRYQEAWQDIQTCRSLGGLPNTELIQLVAGKIGPSRSP